MKRLIAAILLGVILQSGTAAATTYLYVSSTGEDTVSCGTINTPCQTIEEAVSKANPAESTVIRVAQGDYTENLTFTVSIQFLAIEGGWNSDFTKQSKDPALTRITSATNSSVINLVAPLFGNMSLRLSSLHFRGTTDTQRMGVSLSADQTTQLNFTVQQCSFTTYRGQAIALVAQTNSNVSLTLDENRFEGNYQVPESAAWPGAGLSVEAYGGATVTATLSKNRFLGNKSLAGGGVYFYTSDASLTTILENNIIAANTAGNQTLGGNGGGLEAVAGGTGELELTLTNNTIVDNVVVGGVGDNMYFFTADSATLTTYLKNTIVWGGGTDIYMWRASSSPLSLTADFSLIGTVDAGGGSTYTDKSSNLHVDPMLQADYRLSPGSPARNAGICGINIELLGVTHFTRIAPYDDIDGDPRPGDETLLGCDIGADEYSFSWLLFNPAFTRKK